MLDGHQVVSAPAGDGLRGVALGVHCIDRDDRGGETGERFQQVPHRGDLIRFVLHGDLAENRADAVRQCRDQVRRLPCLVLRAADGLAVDGDHEPAAGLHRPGVQPGTEDPVEHVRADQGEGAPEGGLLRRAAGRAQHRQRLRPGISGPLPDRGERPRPCDHRRDPDGQQPGQRVPAAAPLPRVRDLGQEIEQVLAAGSRNRRRCHRRAGVPRQKMVSVGTSIVPPGPCPPPGDTPGISPAVTKPQLTASIHDFAGSLVSGGLKFAEQGADFLVIGFQNHDCI
jgi:hypothetical protein